MSWTCCFISSGIHWHHKAEKSCIMSFQTIILFVWRQFPSSAKGKLREKSQRRCPSSLVITLMLWASLRTRQWLCKMLIHSNRSEVSIRDHWNWRKPFYFTLSAVYWWTWNAHPCISFLPPDAFKRRGKTHPQESSWWLISAFQFCTALSHQAHKTFIMVHTV